MVHKKIVYLSGPITNVPEYWKAFEKVEEDLISLDCAVLSPAKLPEGMSRSVYMQIDLIMLVVADEVWFIPGYRSSRGANVELLLSQYVGKKYACFDTWDAYRSYMSKLTEKGDGHT